ncbi:Deoxyhypusine synthase [Trachipleistophora hominis]|uniref:deoxyhypusine synthase n=1 Tax=Trachipleistophora hominis TaxID=72359 RepID=L7JZG9_TRAHO|nr:Deoxyhypusine synthase [Trachipleistophora hominis]
MDSKSVKKLLRIYKNSLFEGRNVYLACKEIAKMTKYKVFMALTANILNNGTYDLLFSLIEKNMVHVVVTTGDFVVYDILRTLIGKDLNEKAFTAEDEETIKNFIGQIALENCGATIPPSKFIKIIGEKLGFNSILGQAARNNVHFYAPTICDSLIGIYCTDIHVDSLKDVYNINYECFFVKKTGAIILGTSVIKHTVLNANLFKNGLNSCVIVNTCNEVDGSDSGGDVDEAISWGKIRGNTTSVKIRADPSVIFPIIGSYWLSKV